MVAVDPNPCVVFDIFGWGESDVGGSEEDWSARSRVADLLALADAINAPTFHLVGESYGGTIALMVALDAPSASKPSRFPMPPCRVLRRFLDRRAGRGMATLL
jgi:pimeloyl-ACP methyl ester carboxylesterase